MAEENQEIITIYPHTGVAVIAIAKVWAICAILVVGLTWASSNVLPADLVVPAKWAAFLLLAGAIFFAVHQLLHFANTYIQITPQAMIYKKGWIPSYTDTIFWVNIKDVNSSCSVFESMLGTGTIILVVAIRNETGVVRVGYLPQHEAICQAIRDKIGRLTDGTRQVTYT